MNARSNKLMEQCLIFSGIICALFFLLTMFVVLARDSWENGLRAAVENVLPAPEYFVGKKIPVKAKGNDAICFELLHNEGGQMPAAEKMALVMRVTTYYGPLPAVFSYEDGHARFRGMAYLKSSVKEEFVESKADRQMAFWLSTAERIFEDASQGVSK